MGYCKQPADHSPSGDSFVCLELEKGGFIHEVHQCKKVDNEIRLVDFLKERRKAAADDDLFILFSTGHVDPLIAHERRCAYVDQSCWKEYYGPFAARAYFVRVTLPPMINSARRDILELARGIGPSYSAGIVEDRKESGPFASPEDARRRLKRKGLNVGKNVLKRLRY